MIQTKAAPGEAPFYIPVTGAASRPRRTLKHDDTFAVFDSHGDIGATAGGPDGMFDRDTRYLSHLELLIDGTQPLLLGSAIRDDNLNFYVDLTNADGEHRRVFVATCTRCQALHLCHRFQSRVGAGVDAVILQRPSRSSSPAQVRDARDGSCRDLQQRSERDPVPVDGGPSYADHV